MKELTEKDFKCKNHVYITDYAKGAKTGGFAIYGDFINFFRYLVHFPKLFIHQVFCPDNPMLHERSNYNYKKYDKYLGAHKYALAKTMVMTIHKTKKKTLEFISV